MSRPVSRCLCWAAVLPVAGALLAQTTPPPAGVSGTVTNSLTGEPILRAHVMVSCLPDGPPRDRQAYGALTNEKGKFSVTGLPPGNCAVNAERMGFVTNMTGASYPLASGAHKEDFKLTLTPTGAITGRVLDSAGEPSQGIQVSADGPRGNAAGVATDDKGQFRLGGLRPGKYRVKAVPQTLPFPPEIRSDGSTEIHDSATYFPDSLSAKTAQRVEVKAGADVSAVDIRLVRTPIIEASGRVTGLPAGFKNVMVSVEPAGQGASVNANGTFTLWRLDPGKYTLVANSYSGQSSLMSAPLDIEIAGANLEHLELRMIPPFDIAGHMSFEDEQAREPAKPPAQPGQKAPPAPPPEPRRVELHPLQQQTGQSASAVIGADDSFTLQKVQPGRYRVAINWGSGYVKSLRAGDTESEGDILDVRNGSAGPLTVTVSANFCEVSGTVSDFKGPVDNAPVILEPAEDPSNIRLALTDSTGAYKFGAVPPGKYKLIPVGEEDAPIVIGLPDQSLEDYDEVAESLDLRAGDKIGKDLTQRK